MISGDVYKRQVPHILQLRADEIAKIRQLVRRHIAHQDMRVVHPPNFVVVDIFRAHLAGQPVHGLIRLLRDGFLRLHLQNQVRAALQVQTQFDLTAEIIFQIG